MTVGEIDLRGGADDLRSPHRAWCRVEPDDSLGARFSLVMRERLRGLRR